MSKRKYSEVEMIGALKQLEAGRTAAEIGRELGVSYRVYREAGPLIRRKSRKRLVRTGVARAAVTGANQEWALDFVHDPAESGRKFRVLSVIDVYPRECLALRVETGFASRMVTRELEHRGGARSPGSDSLRQRT